MISTGYRCPLYDGGADDTSESLPGTINSKIIPDRSANVTMPDEVLLDNVVGAGVVDAAATSSWAMHSHSASSARPRSSSTRWLVPGVLPCVEPCFLKGRRDGAGEPVDPAHVGRSVVRRRAKGMDGSA